MATTPHTPSSAGRYIGRVGALAVALGIGIAIAQGPAAARADDDTSTSTDSTDSTSQSTDTSTTDDSTTDSADERDDGDDEADASDASDASAADDEADDLADELADLDDEGDDSDAAELADETADELGISELDDEPALPDPTEPTGNASESTTVPVASPAAEASTQADDAQGTAADNAPADNAPADNTTAPDTAALLTLAGSARRETDTDATPPPAPQTTTAVAASSIVASETVSALGTAQQLEAERIAAETVKSLPMQLMKLVLTLGWRITAANEYRLIGGPDSENLAQLKGAIDEYAMAVAFQQQLLNSMEPTVVSQVAPPHTWYGRNVGGSRILYDNPDTIYRFMGVNKTSEYVITGRIIGEMSADTSFSVLTGLSGITADYLSGNDLQIEPDGSFVITVSAEAAAPGQTNHLQLTSDATLVAVRNTLSDWNTQPPMELAIERVAGPPNSLFSQIGGFAIPLIGPTVADSPLLTSLVSLIPPLPQQPRVLRGTVAALIMVLGLSQEAKYIKVATRDADTGERKAPNYLPDPTSNAEFLATQLQSAGYFDLDDQEALVVTIDPGKAAYFNVPVTNQWTITDNYWDQQTSLNVTQATPDDPANPDGTYTLVISPTDPGVYNWVSTGGLNQGTLSLRFQDLDPDSDAMPTVSATVVPLPQLPDVLPATTRYVTPAEREEQLAVRKAGYNVRFAPFPQP